EDALGESELHHRLAARDGEPAAEAAQRGSKIAKALQDLLGGYIGAVLEMPGIGVVAIGAAQEAARHEQHDPEAGAVVARRRLIGMAVAERAFLILELVLIGSVRR